MPEREVLMTLPSDLQMVLDAVCLINYTPPPGAVFYAYYTQSVGAALLMQDGPAQELNLGPNSRGADRVDRWIYTQSHLKFHCVGPHAGQVKRSVLNAVQAAHDALPESVRLRVKVAPWQNGGPLEYVWQEDTETGLVWRHPNARAASENQLHLPVYAMDPDEFMTECLVALDQPWMPLAYQCTPSRSHSKDRGLWLMKNTADACLICLAEQMKIATDALYGMGLHDLYKPENVQIRIEIANEVCSPIIRLGWLEYAGTAMKYVVLRWQEINRDHRRSPSFNRVEESSEQEVYMWAERAMPAFHILYNYMKLKSMDGHATQDMAWLLVSMHFRDWQEELVLGSEEH